MKIYKIAHILHSFGTGGMEKGVATLVANASPDVEHVIICLTQSGNTARLLPRGTQIIEMDKKPGNSFRFLRRLARLLKQLAPDVVHTRNWGGTDGIIAARLAGIQAVVHSEHGFGPENPDGTIFRRILVHRILSLWVKEYVALSRSLKDWLTNQAKIKKPVTQIYNGVDIEQYCPGPGAANRMKYGVPEENLIVGNVASLNTIKDHSTLIKGFNILQKDHPDAVLWIVGDGPECERLKALAGPGVCFFGNREDVSDIMKAFDVFVLSSINEGISNTILEAMATGLPVVASDVGGNPELLVDGSTGTLFPSGDSVVLAAKLIRYAESSDLRNRHGRQGRKKAVADFSVRAMVERYEATWKRIAQSSS